MESKTQGKFLELVPLVHTRLQGWTIRSIRAKDIPAVKSLNVFPVNMSMLMFRTLR